MTRWPPRTSTSAFMMAARSRPAGPARRQQQVLDGHVLVLQRLGLGERLLQCVAQRPAGRRRTFAALHPRPAAQPFLDSGAHRRRRPPAFSEHRAQRRSAPGRAAPTSRWSVVISGLPRWTASPWAEANPSGALMAAFEKSIPVGVWVVDQATRSRRYEAAHLGQFAPNPLRGSEPLPLRSVTLPGPGRSMVSSSCMHLGDAGQVQAQLAGQVGDPGQAGDVGVGVAAGAARACAAAAPARAPRTCAGSADAGPTARPPPRSSSAAGRTARSCGALPQRAVRGDRRGWACCSSSQLLQRLPAPASTTWRGRRSAAAPAGRRCRRPTSLGAPRPSARSILPSVEPAGTRTVTVCPSGVGSSTCEPIAASEKVTGTSITRSLAAAAEERARVHPGDHVQIARLRRPARRSRPASDLDAGAVAHPGRDPAPGRSSWCARGRCRGRSRTGVRSRCRPRRTGRRGG